jgi:hypothetical protein
MSKKVTNVDQAVEILRGTIGIKVDAKNKTLTWSFGRKYSEKVVNAGKFLDHFELGTGGNFRTTWVDTDGELPFWGNKNNKKK